METLSVTQKYVLCSLNKKGMLPLLNKGIAVCILAGGLIELLAEGSIRIDVNKEITVKGEPGGRTYLRPLFDWIKGAKPVSIDNVLQEFSLGISDKRFDALFAEICSSLVKNGCVTAGKGGIFKKTDVFIPNADEADKVIRKIRDELLGRGPISDETVALAGLMEKSFQIKKYFSEYESERLVERLKEIREAPSNKLIKQIMDQMDAILAFYAAVIMASGAV